MCRHGGISTWLVSLLLSLKGVPSRILFARPDHGAKLWEPQLARFEEANYHCIRILNPNCNGKVSYSWGLDFDEIADAIADIIRRPDVSNGSAHVVGHDWGAAFSYCLGDEK